jgi:hypothetical protein
MSETTNSSLPAAPPTLTRAPTSMLRAVITPSKGATSVVYFFSACSRETLACSACTLAWRDTKSFCFSSASCLDTAFCPTSDCQRLAVLSASVRPVRATASWAWAWARSWSRSGVSIWASTWPALTWVPMSTFQRDR